LFFSFYWDLFEDREREAAPAFSDEPFVESHLRYDAWNSRYGA